MLCVWGWLKCSLVATTVVDLPHGRMVLCDGHAILMAEWYEHIYEPKVYPIGEAPEG